MRAGRGSHELLRCMSSWHKAWKPKAQSAPKVAARSAVSGQRPSRAAAQAAAKCSAKRARAAAAVAAAALRRAER